MIHFIVLSEFLKIFNPYVRKTILIQMDPAEFLLLNSIIVFLICVSLFVYKIANEDHKMGVTIKRYRSMSFVQVLFSLWIGLATALSGMVILTMDKHYNTPLINNMIFKFSSVILLVLTGVIIFKEKYNFQQLLGIALIVIGGILLFYYSEGSMTFKKEHSIF